MPIGDIAPALSMTVGAALTLLFALFTPRRHQRLCAAAGLLVLLTAAVLTVRLQLLTSPILIFSGVWALDDLTAWTSYAILGSTALVVLLSPSWFRMDPRHGEWYVILLFSALGAILMAGAADLMELMVAVLLSSVTGYTLASYHRASRMCAEAGAKYYFLGAIANPMMFLGVVFLYALAGDTAYLMLSGHLQYLGAEPVVLASGLGLLLIGFFFKLGAVPGHSWVPDAAQGSPAPAAAFLTVVPKIGALVALVRVAGLLPDDFLFWRWVVAAVAALTMSLGNLAALWQDDVRRLIGWSSVSQTGYGLMAVVVAGYAPMDRQALILFIFAYALGNLTAFGVVVSLRGRTTLSDYSGLLRTRPWHTAALTLSFLSLAGIPPLIGFTAKLFLFGAAIKAGFAWLAVVAVINTVVSLFYYLRVVGAMFLGNNTGPAHLLDRPSVIAFSVSAVLIVGLGLAAELLLSGGPASGVDLFRN
jgi:NADH-quinone oxidoreductase subunit N